MTDPEVPLDIGQLVWADGETVQGIDVGPLGPVQTDIQVGPIGLTVGRAAEVPDLRTVGRPGPCRRRAVGPGG